MGPTQIQEGPGDSASQWGRSKVILQKDSRLDCLFLGNKSTTSLPVQATLRIASFDNLCVCVWLRISLFKEINSECSLEGLGLTLKL